MRRTWLLWLTLAALYAGFRLWYDGGGPPLTPEEVAHYTAILAERGAEPEQLAAVREFLANDDGGDFVMANLIRFRETPLPVGDVEPGESSQQALDRYMAHMYPALLRRACHPVRRGHRGHLRAGCVCAEHLSSRHEQPRDREGFSNPDRIASARDQPVREPAANDRRDRHAREAEHRVQPHQMQRQIALFLKVRRQPCNAEKQIAAITECSDEYSPDGRGAENGGERSIRARRFRLHRSLRLVTWHQKQPWQQPSSSSTT